MSVACLVMSAPAARAADWTPAKWGDEQTLQFRTDCPGEGEHWSYVWVAVIDGDLYVRLGSQAASRVDCSSTKPMTSIRIAGAQFDDVEMIQSPQMATRVADFMANKYWLDLGVRYMNHPYTMKLVQKSSA
ncbi:MAG TPA: hypothetical protein VGK20_19160 [Candidatus Binatia bacterium]